MPTGSKHLTPISQTRAVLLDAGLTLTFPDGARIAEIAKSAGVDVAPQALEDAALVARREAALFGWAATAAQSAEEKRKAAGPAFFRRLLELATRDALATGVLDAAAEVIWASHLKRNTWCRVGSGVKAALELLRAADLKLAVVSNSEGTVEAMLEEVGLRSYMDTVIDSWIVGVAKPDPRIFALTLERLGVSADQAIMVGDTPDIDIAGAHAAGVNAVLMDPLDLHPAAAVPRFPDLPAFVTAFLTGRSATTR